MFVVGPFWNHVRVPLVVRNGVVLLLVVSVWSRIAAHALPPVDGLWSLLMLVLPEFVVGASIGFMARIIFAAAEYGGSSSA